jgi:acetyl-CoA synthetase
MLMRESPSLFAAFDLSKLKHVFCVGEWLEPRVAQWARDVLGREPYDTYFQTETGGIVISNRPGLKVRAGSMGQSVAGIEAVVADRDGRELPAGAEGRLCLSPGWPSMLTGYVSRSGEQPAKRAGGYYDTGDLARRDDDGYVWFTGRRDDLVNTAGHLVGPADVERALLESPDVAACAVVGIPDDILLEKVAALVVLRPGVEASDDVELNLRLLVTRQLSPIEAPQELRFVEAIPADAAGRVERKSLRPFFAGPGRPASPVREDS